MLQNVFFALPSKSKSLFFKKKFYFQNDKFLREAICKRSNFGKIGMIWRWTQTNDKKYV